MIYSALDPVIGATAALARKLRALMASAHTYCINNSVDQALVATVAKTLLQLVTPATRFAWIKEISIGFKSVTATDVPVLVQLVRQSTAGTASALTPAKDIESQPASLLTAQEIFTAEPTSGAVVREWEITPIGGLIVIQLADGDEIEMAASSRLGLLVTAPQAQSARAYIKFRE